LNETDPTIENETHIQETKSMKATSSPIPLSEYEIEA